MIWVANKIKHLEPNVSNDDCVRKFITFPKKNMKITLIKQDLNLK